MEPLWFFCLAWWGTLWLVASAVIAIRDEDSSMALFWTLLFGAMGLAGAATIAVY